MIRVLLVDDEALARQHLLRILSAHADIEVVAQAANGFEALEQIGEAHPDAVFLDIEMPGFNGFEVIRDLDDPPLIIFATAYDEYAVRAFESNALDYLLKPIQAERVAQCLERVRARLTVRPAEPDVYSKVLHQLGAERSGPRRKIAVRKGKRIVVLKLEEVTHAGIEDKLTFVYTDKERFLSDKTVSQLEESLAESGFFRISRGDLVNLEAVRELVPWFSGTWKTRLRNGVELDVSRERARLLKETLGL